MSVAPRMPCCLVVLVSGALWGLLDPSYCGALAATLSLFPHPFAHSIARSFGCHLLLARRAAARLVVRATCQSPYVDLYLRLQFTLTIS